MVLPNLALTAAYIVGAAVSIVAVIDVVTPQDASTSCSRQEDSAWSMFLLQAVLYVSSTVETFLRAFCFGFGVHILMYLLMVNPNATYEELKSRMNVSMTAGLAFGCVVYGGSMVSNQDGFYQRPIFWCSV
jgi:hypothetical protein